MAIAFIASFWMSGNAAPRTETSTDRLGLSKAAVGAAVLGFVFYGVPGFATLLYIKQREQLHLSLLAVASLDSLNNVAALFGAILYYRLRRRLPLRRMLPVGIVAYAIGSESYLFYSSSLAAPPIEIANGFLSALGLGAMWETAVRGAGDKGQAVTMALVLFASNVGISLSEVIGSSLSSAGMRLDQVIFLHVSCYALLALAMTRAPAHVRELREEKKDAPAEEPPSTGR